MSRASELLLLADAPGDYCACPDMPPHDSGFCPQCGPLQIGRQVGAWIEVVNAGL
jgi:hypothetical protein